eukprot:Lankesteria_metandrocarpae@DN3895_c0_g1_i3.p1
MTAATDTVELAGGAVAACDVDGSLDSDGEDYTRPFELEEDGEEEYTPPSPRVMRASGVEMYKKGQWRRAYDIWSAGLKILLKDAVRGYIREDGRDLTLQYRLCMGQALMKLEQYTEALDQFAVVLDQDPEHIKALYHKALVLFALQDYDGCEATAKEGLAVEPDNKALLQTVNKAVLARHAHKKKQTNLFAKMWRPEEEPTTDSATARVGEDNKKCSKADSGPGGGGVEEKCKVEWEGGGMSDDPTSELWTTHYSGHSLIVEAESRPLILSLPFTVLHALDTSGKELLKKDRLTMHVIGARGDVEMGCMWSAILSRLPHCKELNLIVIGFQDATDEWGMRLHEGQISFGIGKQTVAGDKVLNCSLYKGLYQSFVHTFCGVLTETNHEYFPDIALIAEPAFHRHFDSWMPAMTSLLKHNIFSIVTGYSALEFKSHEARNIPPVLEHLGAALRLPLSDNPYSIRIQPEDGTDPMPCFEGYDSSPTLYSGASAKNAVLVTFKGALPGHADALPVSAEEYSLLKKELRTANVDIDSGELAQEQFENEISKNLQNADC